MQHPITNKRKSIFFYSISWTILGILHYFLLIKYLQISPFNATIDALISNSLFGAIGLCLWFIVRFAKIESKNLIGLFSNHLLAALIAVSVWLGACTLLIRSIIHEPIYLTFLYNSLKWRFVVGLFYYLIIILAFYFSLYYYNYQQKKLNEIKLQSAVTDAELEALKYQLNPHFLFNSLNSISALTLIDSQKAHEMTIALSDFFRYSLDQNEQALSPIKKVLSAMENYLKIEQIRFGERLKYTFELEECTTEIPFYILQPFYENAIKHGVQSSTDTTKIHTTCYGNKEFTVVEIVNSYKNTNKNKQIGTNTGIKNIQKQLDLLYNDSRLLSIHKSDTHFKISLNFPKKRLK